MFLNGWTKEGQQKFNDLMKKVRDDRADYGAAFDSNFMKFCKQMEEDALQKKPKKKKLPESVQIYSCLLYTSPSPRDATLSRMPSSA